MARSSCKNEPSLRVDQLPDIVPSQSDVTSASTVTERKELDSRLTFVEPNFSKMQSVKPYNSANEYLFAMKEDLADWLNKMYNIDINHENFFDVLGNGSLICQHANRVMLAIRKKVQKRIGPSALDARRNSMHFKKNSRMQSSPNDYSLLVDVAFRRDAKLQSFAARDNVSNFISWARWCANVRECLMFETDDLIMLKNERNVILCLLEVARFGAAYGVQVPKLVRFEQDIAREIEREQQKEFQSVTELKRKVEDHQRVTASRKHHDWLDKAKQSIYQHIQVGNNETLRLLREQLKTSTASDFITYDHEDPLLPEVVDLLNECTCAERLQMIPLGPGKYRFGSSSKTVFVRRLNDHLMVNVDQNQWDTLRNYLHQMDPCRSVPAPGPLSLHKIDDGHDCDDKRSMLASDSKNDLDQDSLNESIGSIDDQDSHLENGIDIVEAREGNSSSDSSQADWTEESTIRTSIAHDSTSSAGVSYSSNSTVLDPREPTNVLQLHGARNGLTNASSEEQLDVYGQPNHEDAVKEQTYSVLCDSNDSLNSVSGSVHKPFEIPEIALPVEFLSNGEASAINRRGVGAANGDLTIELQGASGTQDSLDGDLTGPYVNCFTEPVDTPQMPSRIPRLTMKDISGQPVPRSLNLYSKKRTNRRSKSVQSNDTPDSTTGRANGIVPKPNLEPVSSANGSSVRRTHVPKKYNTTNRSVTDTVVKEMTSAGVRTGVARINLSTSSSGDGSTADPSSARFYEGLPFRENRAYQWRRKALLFRNYIRDTPKAERNVFADEYISNHFHYPDLRGSELIYGEQPAQLTDEANSSNDQTSQSKR